MSASTAPTLASKREARSDRTRRALVEAATRLFCARGYAGTTVQAIAAEAGISQGSIFWHFRSKEGLLFAVVEEAFSRWEEEALAPLLAGGTLSSARQVTDAHLEYARRNPEIAGRLLFMLLAQALGPRAELRDPYVRIYRRFRELGRTWLAQARGAGRLDPGLDATATATVVVGALAGIVLQWTLDGDGVDLERTHRDLGSILDRGMRAGAAT